MGAYLYGVRGPAHLTQIVIGGEPNWAGQLEYLEKPFYSCFAEHSTSAGTRRKLNARRHAWERAWAKGHVKPEFVIVVHSLSGSDKDDAKAKPKTGDTVLSWRKGRLSCHDDPDWGGAKEIGVLGEPRPTAGGGKIFPVVQRRPEPRDGPGLTPCPGLAKPHRHLQGNPIGCGLCI